MKNTWRSDPRRWGVIDVTGAPVADVWKRDAIGLIVAAPMLLDACKTAVRVCSSCTPEKRCGVCELLLSAIAVAESEP